MEEDIKILERMIDLSKRTGMDITLSNKLENLLTRYKQLEEENRTLKRVNNMTEDISIEDITQVMDKAYKDFMKEFIPKSKAEEIIKKLDKDIERNNKTKDRIAEDYEGVYSHYIITYEPEAIKKVLQELLESGD